MCQERVLVNEDVGCRRCGGTGAEVFGGRRGEVTPSEPEELACSPVPQIGQECDLWDRFLVGKWQ